MLARTPALGARHVGYAHPNYRSTHCTGSLTFSSVSSGKVPNGDPQLTDSTKDITPTDGSCPFRCRIVTFCVPLEARGLDPRHS